MTTTYELYTNENGTPKAVEGKAPAILERVEALETSVETLEDTLGNGVVTSVNSQTGDVTVDVGVTSVNGNTGDITPEQTGCLPTGGGAVTGKITSSSERVLDSTNANGLFIVADASVSSTKTGAISVFPVNHSQANRAGGFQFVASDGTNNKTLTATYANGLKWDGKNVVCSVNGTSADASGNVTVKPAYEISLIKTVTTKSLYAEGTQTLTFTGLKINQPVWMIITQKGSGNILIKSYNGTTSYTGFNSSVGSIAVATATSISLVVRGNSYDKAASAKISVYQ